MEAHVVPQLAVIDWIMPVVAAASFIAIMSLVPEPKRLRINAVLVAGAGAAYLGGGLGIWEVVFTSVATYVAYRALDSYRFVGIAWLMHSGWDVVHHLAGRPILEFLPPSSAGCAICDALLAVYFFAGAPSWIARRGAR